MNILDLQKPLDVKEIDFRVGEIRGKTDAYATILAYKDARADMKRLDEVTAGVWQNEYRRDSKGILQCGIGIKIGDEWVWKWSNGTESQFEKEKGEYSDAFKRAGFMWGIGRELYEYPQLLTKLVEGEAEIKDGKWKATYKLKPSEWEWTWTENKLTAKQNGKLRTSGMADIEIPQEPQSKSVEPEHKQVDPNWDGVWDAFSMPFGKHKDKTLGMIALEAPTYLAWLIEQRAGGNGAVNPDLDRALKAYQEAAENTVDVPMSGTGETDGNFLTP